MGVRALRDGFQRREFSARCIAESALRRAADLDDLGAFIGLDSASVLAQADALDRRLAAGEVLGPLAGVPVAIKDNICVAGRQTSAASEMLADFRPVRDATVIARLREAGALIFGRTNLDEFAMGSSTENSSSHVTLNPWSREHVPGGSSGGSAVAVAAGIVPLALGSDTGGSIRQPAAFCGVLGLKPSYGRVSRSGLIAFASSLDQIGPIARCAEDAALLLSVIAGADEGDASSQAALIPSKLTALRAQELTGLRIGVPEQALSLGEPEARRLGASRSAEVIEPELAGTIRAALQRLVGVGATLISVSLPRSAEANACYQILSTAEAASNLNRYDGIHFGHRSGEAPSIAALISRSRTEGFGPEVQRRIMLGTFVLSAGQYEAYYLKAQRVRELIRQEHEAALACCDFLALPSSPVAGFLLGEKRDDPLSMYAMDALTVGASLSGFPALSLCCGFSRAGLPIGLQLIGRPFDELGILSLAAAFQELSDFHQRHPGELP